MILEEGGRVAVTTWTDEDVEAIVSYALDAECAKGTIIHHAGRWREKYRERVLQNEQTHPGFIEATVRGMTQPEESTTRAPAREDPASSLFRLYEAKLGELTRYGVREPDRTTMAVDYACSEVWRCSIAPMPEGGIVRLEDELYRRIGVDRCTGLRFPPRAS